MSKLLPISGDFFDSADHVFTTMVELPASRAEIWEALVDNAGWADWFMNCRGCEGTPAIWSAAGNTRTIRVGPVRVDEIAVELVPEQRWAMVLTATSIPFAKRMAESIDLIDTSREGEVRTELQWTGALDPLWHLKPVVSSFGARLANGWGQSFEDLNRYLAERR
jgi:uncharacterized protein YndB with AHSA1/START domain